MSAYLIIIRDDTTLKTEILKVAVKFFTLTLTIILNIDCRGKSATFSWPELRFVATVTTGGRVKFVPAV